MALKGHYALCFKIRVSFEAHHENLNDDRRRSSPMTLDSGNIRFMQIFAVVFKIFVNFPDFMPAPLYYVYRKRHAVFIINLNCFVYDSYLPWVVNCMTSADVASGVAKCDLQSTWNPRKNCGSYVDATSSES